MRHSSFALVAALMAFLLLLPFAGFVVLKYNGLTDNYAIGASEFTIEESPNCNSSIRFGKFLRVYEDEICYALHCTQGKECAIVFGEAGNFDVVEYGESAAALSAARNDYVTAQDATQAEAIADDNGNSEAAPPITYIDRLNQTDYGYALWQWAAIFSLSVTFCALGFTTSLLTRGGRKFAEPDHLSISLLFVFSIVTGIVIVILFEGGLLQGTLFPNFSGDLMNFGFNSWIGLKFRGQDWFKLALWAYIAGFYERFLPDLLTNIINRQKSENQREEAPDMTASSTK